MIRWLKLRRHRARRASRTYPSIECHDTARGLITLVFRNGARAVVCDFCLGNCGQCGNTGRVTPGLPAQMAVMGAQVEGRQLIVSGVRS